MPASLRVFSEWPLLLVASVLVIFFFFDEEPFLDPSDWNIVHVLLLLVSIIIVVNENVVRSRFGQFVYKDQVLLFATFSFWFSIENWARLIVIIFCFHCLSPLELELVELSDTFLSLQLWYTTKLLTPFLIVLVVYTALLILNFYQNWVNLRAMLALAWVALLALLFTFLAMLWDFLLTSMTSCDFTGSRSMLYYNSTRSAITYDAIGAGSDLFDWHVSTNSSFTFRFEDAYCFFLQFFNLVALYSALLVLLFFCLDLLSAQGVTSSCGNPTPGFLYLGVVLRWFDHVWWSFFVSHFSIFLVSLRIFCKVCLDFNF